MHNLGPVILKSESYVVSIPVFFYKLLAFSPLRVIFFHDEVACLVLAKHRKRLVVFLKNRHGFQSLTEGAVLGDKLVEIVLGKELHGVQDIMLREII